MLIEMQDAVKKVFVHGEILAYITELTEKTRTADLVSLGVSTRGAISLASLCRSYAAINGRTFVIPDDVQTMLPYVYQHRIIHRGRGNTAALLQEIIAGTKVPSENWG
jgi:MoxR-like ATPase